MTSIGGTTSRHQAALKNRPYLPIGQKKERKKFVPAATRAAGPDSPDPKKTGRPSLCEVIGAGKSISTVLYIRGVRNLGRDPFLRKLWQRMYTESDVRRIRRYIEENPIHHVQHLT
jgi:hypothetical protein